MLRRKDIVLLGATGSIGEHALRVVAAHPDRLRIRGIAARTNWRKLAAIAEQFSVPHAAIFDEAACREAKTSGCFAGRELHCGMEGLCAIGELPEADIVVSAVVGTTGLVPTLRAIEAGKDIALASKEILVLAGRFVMAAARRRSVRILPVDSEHNAIFQCLQGNGDPTPLRRLILTGSGGPFRGATSEALEAVTPERAQSHPIWSMGPKITVDSATMANKGLEMIEAYWLFGVEPEQIHVVVHPQSIVHSMVEFIDGSILAQLSPPDMTFAIQHALFFPERLNSFAETLDFTRSMQLDFEPPDPERFPCLRLARETLSAGGILPAAYNAANEIAVERFLDHNLRFTEISRVIEHTLNHLQNRTPTSVDDLLDADAEARRIAHTYGS